jgi:mono/diheme cytochrome c family protein
MREQFVAMAVTLLGTAILAGCNTLPASKPLDQLTPQELQGRAVYEAQCARCHYPTKTKPLNGPGLQALYKKPYLPSGAPANDERIRATIIHGRNMMPALSNTVDDQQLNDLLAYLHTL